MREKTLDIQDLSIRYNGSENCVVNNFSLHLFHDEILCLRGRSGIGKSTITAAIMGMLPAHDAVAESGQILFNGRDLLKCSEKSMKKIRWRDIAIVPQSSMNSFNPTYTIRESIREMLTLGGERLSKADMAQRETELMKQVSLDSRALDCYPHEMSGGMKQRAAIALAMVFSPKILILDEATTGLDIKIQADVLGTILRLQRETHMAVLFISHDAALGDKLSARKVEML